MMCHGAQASGLGVGFRLSHKLMAKPERLGLKNIVLRDRFYPYFVCAFLGLGLGLGFNSKWYKASILRARLQKQGPRAGEHVFDVDYGKGEAEDSVPIDRNAHRDRCAQWTHHTHVMHARCVHLPRRGGLAHSQWDWASHGSACRRPR